MADDWVAVIYDYQWWPGTVDSVSPNNQITVLFTKPVAKSTLTFLPTTEVVAKLTESPVQVSNHHFSSSNYARSLNDLIKTVKTLIF